MGVFGEYYELVSLDKVLERLKSRIYTKLCDFDIEIYTSKEPLTFEKRLEGAKKNIGLGDKWGDLFDCAWFHITAKVPETGAGMPLVYVIDINGEGLIYDDSGCPYRAITNVNSEFDRGHGLPGKRIVRHLKSCAEGDQIDFWMDAGCNDLFGKYRGGTVGEAYLAVCDEKARELYYDMFVLLSLAKETSTENPLRYEVLSGLFKVRDILTRFTEEEFDLCFAITKKMLSRKNGDCPVTVSAIGHAHLDLAWLWPIRETKRKGARTFATALENMTRYEDYKFGASQAQLYQWVKEDYPQLYEKVKQKISEKRWELLGAMWVESDTNIPSGESLIRQMIYGNAFFEEEFGQRSNYVWLPDTFGYTGALPQIIKKCGLEYFLTIKISWNKYTNFPYTSFIWKGIDGTEVATHMPPEGNYLSSAAPVALVRLSKMLASKGEFGEEMMFFGIGDGGGGPSPSHLEYLKREKNLLGLAPVEQRLVSDFLKQFRLSADGLPVYEGELYLECHIATYTTQSRSKRYNRKMEQSLRNTELLSALAMRISGYHYPQERLNEIWKEILLYQFHDILPGSSINRVYEESHARYALLLDETSGMGEAALRTICDRIDTIAFTKPKVFFNTLSFECNSWVKTDSGYKFITVPSMGYTVIELSDRDEFENSATTLENEFLYVSFADNGSIKSIYNKKLQKELLSAPSNCLLFYDDTGDAWELEYEYRNKQPEVAVLASSTFLKEGPYNRVIQHYIYGKSSFDLEITLSVYSERLEFHLNADWHEDGIMFRIRFEHAVVSDHVDCEIQFGKISRSNQNNTEAQKAQFEICAQKWISASGYGLEFALLNDCKYGYYAKGNVLEMNCLRSSNFPGIHMESGSQEFSYAIYSSDGSDGNLSTTRQGYDFNFELIGMETGVHNGSLPAEHSFISVKNPQIFVDTVKKAEKSDAVVIRSYEAAGSVTEAEFDYGFEHRDACLCNMVEEQPTKLDSHIPYHGFEIQTILL